MANWIPGINVGNAIKQVGSVVGLAPKGDYDVLDHFTNSNRPGQTQVNWLPDVTTGGGGNQSQVKGSVDVGGGSGSGTGYVAPDPYARWGGVANYNAARQGLDTSQTNLRTGAETSLRDVGNEYDTKTNRFVNEITDSQAGINKGLASNQLNLRTTMGDIVRGIQQGIRSGNVALAGMNAMDSGAADAMARAYATVGNTQTGEARGEAGRQFEELQAQQGQLNRTRNEGLTELDRWGDTETDRVRGDFSGKLSSLAADAASKGIAGFGDQSLVSQVLDAALSRLAAIDQSRDSRLSGVRQNTADEVMKEAIRLENMGQTGTAFSVTGPDVNYGGGTPMAGAPIGELPLYTKNKDDLSVVPKKDDNK